MFTEILGLVAAAFILGSAAPQLLSLLRPGHRQASATDAADARPGPTTEGVSIASWALLLASSLVWFSYGIRIGSPSTTVGNAAGVVAFAAVVMVLVRTRSGRRSVAFLVLPVATAVFVAATLLPDVLAAAVGVVVGISLALPQLVVSWHTWRSGNTSTVPLLSWVFILIGQGLWLTYGLLLSEPAITIVNVIGGSISIGILTLESSIRRSKAPAPVSVASPAFAVEQS